MEQEIWRDIQDHEKFYEVSTLGRVRNKIKGNILTPTADRDGYLRVQLYGTKKRKTLYIARAVAIAFIPNPFNLPEIDHINGDRTDNRVENLRWCTRQQNVDWANSKKVLQLNREGELIKEWASTSECGRNGYSKNRVGECCRGELKTYRGYIWKYA